MPDTTPVREVMTGDVVTLRPDQPVQEAADVLAGKHIGAAPVVDDSGKVVGLLRDEDLIVSEARLHVPTVISFLGADLVLPPSMQADVVDVDRVESGQQRTGLFFALWSMATKLALAAAVGAAFPILEAAGYDPAAPDGTGDFALALLYGTVPVAFKLAAVALMWRYPLTRRRQAEIRDRIEAVAAGSPS